MISRTQPKSNIGKAWIGTTLVFFGLGGLLWIGFSEFNPDWLSYLIIYETGGAWLAEYGQDPAFLLLIVFANYLLGPAGYELFRLILSIYFLFFSAAIVLGKIIPITYSRWLPLQLSLAIISFGFTRFTVQIREGVAATLILFGLACIMKGDVARDSLIRQIFLAAGLAFFCFAVLTHVGTIALLAGVILGLLSQRFGRVLSFRIKTVWVSVSLGGFMVLGWVAVGGLEQFGTAAEGISERVFYGEESSLSPLKILLWGCYGVVSVLVARALREIVSCRQLRGRLAATLLILSGPLTFVTLISIYVLIIIGAPTFYAGQYVRLLNLLLGLSLLFVAAQSKNVVTISFSAVFLIGYQIYSVVEAISVY